MFHPHNSALYKHTHTCMHTYTHVHTQTLASRLHTHVQWPELHCHTKPPTVAKPGERLSLNSVQTYIQAVNMQTSDQKRSTTVRRHVRKWIRCKRTTYVRTSAAQAGTQTAAAADSAHLINRRTMNFFLHVRCTVHLTTKRGCPRHSTT